MSELTPYNIVRISNNNTKDVLGTGFLVEGGFIFTAKHVFGDKKPISINNYAFEACQKDDEDKTIFNLPLQVSNIDFHDKIYLDLAICSLENWGALADRCLKIIPHDYSTKHNPISLYGFPKNSPMGFPISSAYVDNLSAIDPKEGFKILALGFNGKNTIESGYSGGPIFDVQLNGVIGLISDRIKPEVSFQGAWGIQSGTIIQFLKEKKEYVTDFEKNLKFTDNEGKLRLLVIQRGSEESNQFCDLIKEDSTLEVKYAFRRRSDNSILNTNFEDLKELWLDCDCVCFLVDHKTKFKEFITNETNIFKLRNKNKKKEIWVNINLTFNDFRSFIGNNDCITFPQEDSIYKGGYVEMEKTYHKDEILTTFCKLINNNLRKVSPSFDTFFIEHFNFEAQIEDFNDQLKEYENHKVIVFIIEGTEKCMIGLLIQRIFKKMKKKGNNEAYKIDLINASYSQKIWNLLYYEIKQSNTDSINDAFSTINHRIRERDLFLILTIPLLDSPNYPILLNEFWAELNEHVELKESKGRIIIFLVNKKADQKLIVDEIKFPPSEKLYFVPLRKIEDLTKKKYWDRVYHDWINKDEEEEVYLSAFNIRRLKENWKTKFEPHDYLLDAATEIYELLDINRRDIIYNMP